MPDKEKEQQESQSLVNVDDSFKKIIIVSVGIAAIVMYNPRIIRKDMPYEAEESCLSLTGTRKTVRYLNIEVDHLNGVII